MLGISIELGSYSIKLLSYRIDRKSTRLLSTEEIILDHNVDYNSIENENQLWDEQLKLLSEYLSRLDHEYQILLNIPSQVVSTRYLNLPVKNKKKAYLMLPYLIEEDLPYSLNECTYGESFIVYPDQIKAIVGIVKNEHFYGFYDQLKAHKVHPHLLTSDTSNYSSFAKKFKENFPSSFSIINIGHKATRGFYFLDGELVANHQSYVAGDSITKAISTSYNISYDEATIYKHQNSFMLLDEQMDEVDENQREFAELMDSTIALLISEIKRWDIGFRVNYGQAIKDIYICGGSANIKNIKNYLSAKLGVNVHFFDPYDLMDASQIDQDEKLRRKFAQMASLAINSSRRGKLINFLKGDLALTQGASLPIESLAFISLRTAILTVIISSFFMVEYFMTSSQIKKADQVIKGFTKNPATSSVITKRTVRSITGPGTNSRSLKQVMNKLSAKGRTIKQEVKTVQSALSLNALSNITQFIDLIGGADVEVINFVKSNSGNLDIVLKSKELSTLKEISATFKSDKSQKWNIDLKEDKMTLAISGKRFSK